MKKCTKCEIEKPLSEFYSCKGKRDGKFSSCKECTKLRVRANYHKNIEYYRAFDRGRIDDPKRKKARRDYAKKMACDVEFQARRKIKTKEWQHKNHLKRAAHIIWGNALKGKRATLKDGCECCDEVNDLQAHHEDYTKPLDVVTLCRSCHGHRHREINALIRSGEDWSDKGF
ncbi:hypothetical protein OAF54_01000 [bacterium]|nr:hypothetical protein [bacterium]